MNHKDSCTTLLYGIHPSFKKWSPKPIYRSTALRRGATLARQLTQKPRIFSKLNCSAELENYSYRNFMSNFIWTSPRVPAGDAPCVCLIWIAKWDAKTHRWGLLCPKNVKKVLILSVWYILGSIWKNRNFSYFCLLVWRSTPGWHLKTVNHKISNSSNRPQMVSKCIVGACFAHRM